MQKLLKIVTLGLVASRALAAYAYRYPTADCSGDAGSGISAKSDTCFPTGSTKITCNSTHLTALMFDSGCTGTPSDSKYYPLGVCTNYSKYYCDGDSTTNPPANTAFFQTLYSSTGCGGDKFETWTKFGVCLPNEDGEMSSTKLQYNTSTKMVDTWSFDTKDCTGNSNVNSDQSEMAADLTYTSSSTSITSTVSTETYTTSDCSGSPITGTAFNSPDGCVPGSSTGFSCVSGTVIIWDYTGTCPDGNKTQLANFTSGTCVPQSGGYYKLSCGTLNVPAQVQLTQSLAGGCSGSVQAATWSALNTCVGGQKITYDSSAQTFTTSAYTASDCTGTPIYTNTQHVFSALSALTTSGSASLAPSLFLFSLLALIAKIVMN